MKRLFCLSALIGFAWFVPASADDLPENPGLAEVAGQLLPLIEQLEAPEFSNRQEASRQLSEAGKSAFPSLERTVAGSSREASGRALDVLKGHFQRGDNETKAAAKEALERLARNENAAIAQRAQQVLNPPPKPSASDLGIMVAPAAQIQIANLQLNRPIAVVPAIGRSVSTMRSANGAIRIVVTENGKSTEIKSTPGGKIEVQVTDTRNAKASKQFEAKDVDELKKKDEAIAKIYEQYSQPPQLRVNAFRPAGAAPLPRAPQAPAETLRRQIDSLNTQIERLKANSPDDQGRKRALDDLKTLRTKFQKQLEQLEQPAEASKPVAPAKPADADRGVGGQ